MNEFVQDKIIKHACRCLLFGQILACAPAPASIPWVRIDRSLSGPVMSREAAEAIDAYRTRDRAACAKQVIDCTARAEASDVKAQRGAWWEQNGPIVVGASSAAAFLLGILLGTLLPGAPR